VVPWSGAVTAALHSSPTTLALLILLRRDKYVLLTRETTYLLSLLYLPHSQMGPSFPSQPKKSALPKYLLHIGAGFAISTVITSILCVLILLSYTSIYIFLNHVIDKSQETARQKKNSHDKVSRARKGKVMIK